MIKVALLFVNLAVVSFAGNSSGKYYQVARYICDDCTFNNTVYLLRHSKILSLLFTQEVKIAFSLKFKRRFMPGKTPGALVNVEVIESI